MLNAYAFQGAQLVRRDALAAVAPVSATAADTDTVATSPLVWIDLYNGSKDENQLVEKQLGLTLPTMAEMEEIEISSRLYSEDGAEFLTIIALSALEGDEPRKTPITFIIKGQTLITVRHDEPRSFPAFVARAQRPNAISCRTGELVMLGLIETLIDRIADSLERTGDVVDRMSNEVFRPTDTKVSKKTRNLQTVIERIGKQGDLLTMFRESLVSMSRLTSYHTAIDEVSSRTAAKEVRTRLKIIQRDVASLSDHAAFLSSKINFLLDATLGLINLEQNQIIKIFSVAAVVFLPPTLVASIYGMNFDLIPELHLPFGYPLALMLMVISAVLPYLFFKRRGWL
jgi:magnesium transporter